jgi:uridylate kinase
MAAEPAPRADGSPGFRRIMLKLSGEALMGPAEYGLDAKTVDILAQELVEVHSTGLELSLVIGGGNVYRGMKAAAADDTRPATHGDARTVFQLLAVRGARAARRRHACSRRSTSARWPSLHPPPRSGT